MMKLFKLLRRIIIHKFWVAYYCFQLGLYWQGITHDLSKFSLTEIKGALKYWHDKKSSLAYEKELVGYSSTFLHHRGRNPHHYEYWIHSLDSGGVPARMPRKYVLELICDYLAACRTYGGNPRNEIDWWLKVSPLIKMHEDTKFYIYRVFDYFHSRPNASLGEAVAYADYAEGISIGDTVYSEFIEAIKYLNERNLVATNSFLEPKRVQ